MITIEKFQAASINSSVSKFKVLEFMTCKVYEQIYEGEDGKWVMIWVCCIPPFFPHHFSLKCIGHDV